MFDLMQVLCDGSLVPTADLHLLGFRPTALGSGLQPFEALTLAQSTARRRDLLYFSAKRLHAAKWWLGNAAFQ